MNVMTDAVQIFGGIRPYHGLSGRTHDARAKLTQILEGTNEIQRMVIARELLC
ncbi:alkylation response protein AidB-like acyl-CoA dehydrogenase [Bradyrhizobium sp. AZCC 2176]